MNNKNNEVSYSNDVFLKYAMIGEDEDAAYIRHAFIKYMANVESQKSRVENTELDTSIDDQTSIILDARIKNKIGIEKAINVQLSPIIKTKKISYGYYVAKMFSEILVDEEEYRTQKQMYQVMITMINYADGIDLLDEFRMRNEDGELESEDALINRNHVNLYLMDTIVEEKGIEKLSEFEQLCYLLADDENLNKLKTKSSLIQKLMKKHEQMQLDDHAWTLAKAYEINAQ